MNSNFELIAYTASWCPHCINLKPTLLKIKNWCEKQNIKYINYDADINKDKMKGIEGYPTVKLYKISNSNSLNLNRQSNNSIELHSRDFEGMKQEINNFINSSSIKGGYHYPNNYSFQQVYSHHSTYQNGKQIEDKYYTKECKDGKCRIYKLNKPQIQEKENELFDLNPKIGGFYNAFGEFEVDEEYNPNIDYKEKYNKYKYKLLHLQGKI